MRVAVAASGGRDSTALLHCTLRAAAPLGIEVVALHVNHGLLPQAGAWERQLRRQVLRWARAGWPVRLLVTRIADAPSRGQSVEAWARARRYAALATMARQSGCAAVLLAHHQRDQAETVLLQALRGGGPRGLAAMSVSLERDGVTWLRPWLAQPPASIAAYVRRWRLSHVDDPSNADPRYARSRLREQVMPALRDAFPEADSALAAAARHGQGIRQCLLELASLDLARVAREGSIDLRTWSELSAPRRANALRHWLAASEPTQAVPESLVTRLTVEAGATEAGRWPWGTAWLQVHDGQLHIVPASPARAAPAEVAIDLSAPGRHRIDGWNGCLLVTRAPRGLPPERLRAARCRERSGGERFRLQPLAADRSLKKQYQAVGVPAWQRTGPMVCDAQGLLFVPGLGIDARACRVSPTGRAELRALRWIPDPPASAGGKGRAA